MLISVNWLHDFVNCSDIQPGELADRLTLRTAEVEGVTSHLGHLADVCVAEILSIEPHPNADKLQLPRVRFGDEDEKQVVCGAKNIKAGMKVPYAPLGVTLPNGLTLSKKKIRGVYSEGMLCSEAELELGQDASGILELPADAPVGSTLAEVLGRSPDTVIDFDNKALTHRPDLWGHLGIAREVAAIFEKELNTRYDDDWAEEQKKHLSTKEPPITLSLEEGTSCIAYQGVSITGVQVEASPEWMQQRLLAVGLRPINNLVDIGNYVMLELGQPLHMFDLEKLRGGRVVVRSALEHEKLLMLDGSEISLSTDDTVVADAERALVLAGIMGGEESGIHDDTKSIFIEAANWNPVEVRRSATTFGMRTDSSQRFEKGLDPTQLEKALLRTVELVLHLCPEARVLGDIQKVGLKEEEVLPKAIQTSPKGIREILGAEYSEKEITEVLLALDFSVVSDEESVLSVVVPSHRGTRDFEHEADLAEEVGRILGYERITPTSPKVSLSPVRDSRTRETEYAIRDFLVFQGQSLEILNQPLVGERLLAAAHWPQQNTALKLLNPLSEDHDQMRPTLFPGLLRAVQENHKHFSDFRAFELGRSYLPSEEADCFHWERRELAVAFFSREYSQYLNLVNVVEPLLEQIGVSFRFVAPSPDYQSTLLPEGWEGSHPVERQEIFAFGTTIGSVFTLHPLLMSENKIRGSVSCCLLDISMVVENRRSTLRGYTPLSKYPSATFDCTVVLPTRVPAEEALLAIDKLPAREITSRKIVTIYEPNPGERYLTIRTEFSNPEKTLSGDEVKNLEGQVLEVLDAAGFALKSA